MNAFNYHPIGYPYPYPSITTMNTTNSTEAVQTKTSQDNSETQDPFAVTPQDLEVLKGQLFKYFVPPKKIIRRCKWGYPQLTTIMRTKNNSKDSMMIPATLIWLTCPRIHYMVDQLEEKKYIKELQQKVDTDENIKKQFLQSHQDYITWVKKNKILTEEQFVQWMTVNRVIGKKTLPENFKQERFGNAGVGYPLSVKCLHAHTAAYLAGTNDIIGKMTVQKAVKEFGIVGDIEDLGILDCPKECVKCRKFVKSQN